MLCDLESCEPYEPLQCDTRNERAMRMGSLALLRAVERAQGKWTPPVHAKRPHAPPVLKIHPAPCEAVGQRIVRLTASAFGYTVDEMLARKRSRRLVLARIVAARLLRNERWKHNGEHKFSLPQIARILRRTDHSTICYSLEMFGPYRRQYPEMKALYNLLRRRLAQ